MECRSGCNIKRDRKNIKLQLLAFDVLKSSIKVFQETRTFQSIWNKKADCAFSSGKMCAIVIFQLIFPEAQH